MKFSVHIDQPYPKNDEPTDTAVTVNEHDMRRTLAEAARYARNLPIGAAPCIIEIRRVN